MHSSPNLLRVLMREFGGMILFWIVFWQFGLKPAIAATILFVLADGGRRLVRGLPFGRIWMLSNLLTLAFGLIDLQAATPFMIRYEATIGSLIAGCAFLVGSFGRKTMIQELAEERQGSPFEDRPDLRLFFRGLTLVWAAYFFGKALAYLWLMQAFPLGQALAIRSVAGTGSFAVMMLLSFRGRAIFALCQRWKLLPVPREGS